MEITIPRSEIKEAVAGIGKVICGKCTLPVLGCVRLQATSDEIVAQATDLDQTLEYRFADAASMRGGECIIPFSALKDISKGGNREYVEIHSESPEQVSIVNNIDSHAVRQPVSGMDLDEWPSVNTEVATKPAPGFVETYRRLAPFSSTDPTRHILNSVYVEVGKGPNPVTMVATDGRRLTCVNSLTLPLKKSIVVPVTKFLMWTRLPEDVELGVREDNELTWLGLKVGGFFYAARTVEGTYPNFRQVIPAEPGGKAMSFSDVDVELLKKVLPSFPGDSDLTVLGKAGKVTLYGRGPDDEQWTTLTLENTGYKGERAFVGLNRQFILDALDAGFREFAITDQLSPVLSHDGNGDTHVVMPLRVEDPEQEDEAEPVATRDLSCAREAEKEPATPVDRSTTRKEKTVTKQNGQKSEAPALDRILVACNTARTKVKEAAQSLTELASAIKSVEREQKVQNKEVEQARAALAKLQAINL